MEQIYLTIKSSGSNEINIKKSRFIGTVARVNSEDEAQAFIDKIKTIHAKATHNCFAYMVGQDDHIQRKSDNGEPSGTAGLPILDAIKLQKLHNTAIVVTRYFGGIKLGAGGLIRAYSNASTEAINHVGIVKRVLQTQLSMAVDYAQSEQLKYFLEQNDVTITNIDYTSKVTIDVSIDKPTVETFQKEVINLLSDRVSFKDNGQHYVEIDYHPHQDE